MEALFLRIVNISITASYVILAVLLVRLFIWRVPKVFSYALWSVVMFRLICPVSFSSMISIFNLRPFDMAVAQRGGSNTLIYVPYDIGVAQTPRITVGIPTANTVISESLPAASPLESVNPMQSIIFIATILWIIGLVVLFIYGVISYIRVKRLVTNAVLFDGNVYECDQTSSPFVLGLIRPKIYIPFRMSEKEREYILCHEQHHIKRLDHIVKPLSFLLLAIYWFNPLVWLAYFCMCRDMEMSCDEKVLSNMGTSIKTDYSMSLLSFAEGRRSVASPLAFGELDVKKRIRNILKFKKPGVFINIVVLLLSIIVILACVANPESQTIKNEDIFSYFEPLSFENINVETSNTITPEDGYVLELRYTDKIEYTVTLNDEELIQMIKDIISGYMLSSWWNEPVNIKEVGDYVRFYAPNGVDKKVYCAFINELIAKTPQLQTDSGRVPISQEQYESLYVLWESHMPLPDTVEVKSGGVKVNALAFRGNEISDENIQDLKDTLQYLPIAPGWKQNNIVPFHVFADGVEQYGNYRLFNAKTMEEIEIMQPSGLPPQTWIFSNVQPGRKYIVELSIGYGINKEYGMKIIFGVTP